MNQKNPASHLEALVRELALPGGRMVGTAGHATAARWVDWQLAQLPLAPYAGHRFALPYSSDGEEFINFAAVVRGTNRELPPLLLGAHYDSVIPHPCADDNAAAVAIVLAVAEQLNVTTRERDIVIALFDAEEPPYFQTPSMGSVRFCEDQADDRGFHAAFILDLVGHDVMLPKLAWVTPAAVKNLLIVQGAESHPGLAEIVGRHRPPQGVSLIAALNAYVEDMSDHFAFRRAGVPFLFFSCGQWPHYHEPTDTPDRLNYRKMACIAETVAALAEATAAVDLTGSVPSHDFTAEMEAETIRRSLGLWLRGAGITAMQDRIDVSAFARLLLSTMTENGNA